MDTSKKRTARIIFVVGIGIIACSVKLWMDTNTSRAVVYTASDAAVVTGSDISLQPRQTALTGQTAGNSGAVGDDQSSGEETNQGQTSTLGEASESTSGVVSDDVTESAQNEKANSTSYSIPVYICGSVSNPGIYHILTGSYLYEAIDLAGGLLPEAAAENINLVYRFSVAVSIYIPSGEEMKSFLAGSESSTSEYLRNGLLQGIWGGGSIDAASVSAGSLSTDPHSTEATLVNINTADQNQLETLPGVGETTAKAIISYREKSGGFTKIEDIMNVTGIKEGRFEAIREFITV